MRNTAVTLAAILFIISVIHVPAVLRIVSLLRSIAYASGTAAYFAEDVILTDGYKKCNSFSLMFMPRVMLLVYILLAVNYLHDYLITLR